MNLQQWDTSPYVDAALNRMEAVRPGEAVALTDIEALGVADLVQRLIKDLDDAENFEEEIDELKDHLDSVKGSLNDALDVIKELQDK